MIAAAAMAIQSDPAIVQQLDHLVTTQTIIAISLGIVALAVLGVAVGALLAIRKVTGLLDKTMTTVTEPVTNLLGTVEDVNQRLRTAVNAVESRVKRFGAVVDVVQSEAEDLLIDATATARGVHTASRVLKSGGRQGLPDRARPENENLDEGVDDGR